MEVKQKSLLSGIGVGFFGFSSNPITFLSSGLLIIITPYLSFASSTLTGIVAIVSAEFF